MGGPRPAPRAATPSPADAHDSEAPTVVEPEEAPSPTVLGLPLRRPTPPRAVEARPPRNLEGTELLARYEVEGVIGHGGMATVYRGRHTGIQKAVAIKVLDAALESTEDAADRFLQEARITSLVVHENVVEVTDFGVTAEGVVFSVMELLHGETLADVLESSGALPLARVVAIMRQVCSALHAAHGHGIIHRDLKPANCFLTPRDSNPDFVKLLDFGIALLADDGDARRTQHTPRSRRTQVGWIIGTPDYMAPEQARAEPCDHRIDVYAAGGLYFELLTGRVPFIGNSAAELFAAHLYQDAPDPGLLVPSLCPEARQIVRTAMAKDPADRYATMAAMSHALADALVAQQHHTDASRRGPWLRRAVATTCVVALGLGFTSLRGCDAPTVAPIGLTRGLVDVAAAGATAPAPSPPVTAPVQAPSSPPPLVEPVRPAPTPMVASEPRPRARSARTKDTPPAATDIAPPVAEARPRPSEIKNPFASPVDPG